MTHRLTVVLRTVLVMAVAAARLASAQRTDSAAGHVDPRDSLFVRARQLVLEGNGDAGRKLVDSVLTASTDTPAYADALYWRAALAATAADAERDYRRVIVEYPFSFHAGDALLALAQLEMARGERASAIDHLQRFLLQRPADPDRIRAGMWLGRLLLESNQLAKGCAVLFRTRASLESDAVEMRNQLDYQAARCAGVDTTPRPARGNAPRTDSARSAASGQSAERAAAPPSRASGTHATSPNRYTVQVAAYETKEAADTLLARLTTRGISARIVLGPKPPFRVRVGRYATEADATAAARDLQAKGIEVFVTTTDNERPLAPERK